jgi:hypothetical protein
MSFGLIRFHGIYYVGLIDRILTTCFSIALSPIASSMIFVRLHRETPRNGLHL